MSLENRRFRKDFADVFWPKSIPESAKHYFNTFTHPLELRNGSAASSQKVFVDDNHRSTCEEVFLDRGVWIRDQCPRLTKYQRPLGNYVLETPGFGATFVTFRNCPNNAPLVFWAGDPWYPLFPRDTNTVTALTTAFEDLWD